MIFGWLRLLFFGLIGLTITYFLVSVYSRSVRRERLEKRFDEGDVINGLSIDCANFPNGSYFLSLFTEGGSVSLTKRVQVLKK